MKKILISFTFLISIFSLFILTGCNSIEIPVGVRPTKKFTVVDYVQNQAIFEAKSKVKISGVSESGVIIVATLYDNKGDEVTEVYTDTSEDGIWKLEFDAPSASYKTYTLKIKDSIGVYHHTFNEIKFGYVWLVTGEEIKNTNLEEKSDIDVETGYKPTDYNKMFYVDNKWIPATKEVSVFGYELIEKRKNNSLSWNKAPIAVVFATTNDSAIYTWLSRDIIESRKVIKDFLINNDLYVKNETLIENGMAYNYEKYFNTIKNLSYSNIIFNQSTIDLENLNKNKYYDDKSFISVYSLMFYSLIANFDDNFNVNNKIFIIQKGSIYIDNISLLRRIESSMTNFFNKCEIIPTYDIALLYSKNYKKYLSQEEYQEYLNNDSNTINDLELHGIDFNKLLTRISDNLDENMQAPILNDVVQEYNEDNEVKSIILIFKNIQYFNNDNKIIGLEFIDVNGKIIDVDYQIIDNKIIINLEKTLEIVEEETNPENSDKYIKLSAIRYGQNSFIYDNNLGNDYIKVIPFEIILKK